MVAELSTVIIHQEVQKGRGSGFLYVLVHFSVALDWVFLSFPPLFLSFPKPTFFRVQASLYTMRPLSDLNSEFPPEQIRGPNKLLTTMLEMFGGVSRYSAIEI